MDATENSVRGRQITGLETHRTLESFTRTILVDTYLNFLLNSTTQSVVYRVMALKR